MNPTQHGVSSDAQPLSKILRKRKSRKSIAVSGLRDIQESRFEQHFYTVGRSSAGTGSQWVTAKGMDSFGPHQPHIENANQNPGSINVKVDENSSSKPLEHSNLRRNKYIKNSKPAASHRKLHPTFSLPAQNSRIFKSHSPIYRLQNDWPNSKITKNTDQVVPNGISQENGVTIVNIHNEDNSFIDEFDKIDMNSTAEVEDTYCYTYSDFISPAEVIKMDENQECVEGEENIYEEINSLSPSEIEEPISLLHGISAGRREMIRNYALADWDFEQQFQDSNFEENATMKCIKRGRSLKAKLQNNSHDSLDVRLYKNKQRSKSQCEPRKKGTLKEFNDKPSGRPTFESSEIFSTGNRRNTGKIKSVIANKFIATIKRMK